MNTESSSPADGENTGGPAGTWSDRQALALIAAVATAYVLATVLGRWAALVGVDLRFAPGVAVALGLLLGPVAAWGAAIGHVFTDLLSGTLAADTAVGYVAQFALVVSAYRLWGTFGPLSDTSSPGVPTVRNLVEYAVVAVTAAGFATAVTAWGLLLLGESPFSPTLAVTLPSVVTSVLIVGPLVLYGTAALVEGRGVLPISVVRDGRSSGLFVLAVVLVWCLGGYVVGIVFQSVETEVTHAVVNQVGRFVLAILKVAGPGGLYLQAAGGGVALVLCLWGLRHTQSPPFDT